jgi:hypothetical protein
MTKRFLVCNCKQCAGWTFMSWYDTLEDIESANKELKRLRRAGREPHIEEFADDAPMPKYCDCRRNAKSGEPKWMLVESTPPETKP